MNGEAWDLLTDNGRQREIIVCLEAMGVFRTLQGRIVDLEGLQPVCNESAPHISGSPAAIQEAG